MCPLMKECHVTQGFASGIKPKSIESLYPAVSFIGNPSTGEYVELHLECAISKSRLWETRQVKWSRFFNRSIVKKRQGGQQIKRDLNDIKLLMRKIKIQFLAIQNWVIKLFLKMQGNDGSKVRRVITFRGMELRPQMRGGTSACRVLFLDLGYRNSLYITLIRTL